MRPRIGYQLYVCTKIAVQKVLVLRRSRGVVEEAGINYIHGAKLFQCYLAQLEKVYARRRRAVE
jgi:hypothetical protein